jgi:glycosyltransferase involved in cell wall biosynthesis
MENEHSLATENQLLMNILIVHNTLNDSRSVNGVLRHYVLMAREWIRLGHPTDFVVARAGWPQLRELAPASELVSSDNVFDATRYLAQTWRYFPAYAWRMLTAHWLRLPRRYDRVIASSPFAFEVYPSMVLARRTGAKLAVKIHHVLNAQEGRRGLFDRLYLRAEERSCRWINRQAGAIFCSVRAVAEDYRRLELRLGLKPRETEVTGYGADLDAFGGTGNSSKPFDAVFLGRLHEHKGVFELPGYWAEVVRQRPGAKLLIIGAGPRQERLEELFQLKGLSSWVTFTGGISEARKNELLVQAKVGITLSYEEGWGLSITEFMASGLPVVAYQLPVYDEVFAGQLERVNAGDWRAAAARTLALLGDEARREELGRAGRAFVRRYDYRAVAAKELAALQATFGA